MTEQGLGWDYKYADVQRSYNILTLDTNIQSLDIIVAVMLCEFSSRFVNNHWLYSSKCDMHVTNTNDCEQDRSILVSQS